MTAKRPVGRPRKSPGTLRRTMALSLPPQLIERLRARAWVWGDSASSLAEQLLREGLDDIDERMGGPNRDAG